MFRSSEEFAFTRLLEDNWQDVLHEYETVARELHAWPERSYYKGDWDTFGLYAFGHKRPDNCARCPRTTQLVEAIPGMVMAGFSRLAPGTHIAPHQGYGGWASPNGLDLGGHSDR
jgi:beta-hydroxylase